VAGQAQATCEAMIRDYEVRYRTPSMPTCLEDPTVYGVLLEMSERIESVAAPLEAEGALHRPQHILIGSLPGAAIQAKTESPNNGSYVVTVHLGLMLMIRDLAQVLAVALQPLASCESAPCFNAQAGTSTEHAHALMQSIVEQFVIAGDPKDVALPLVSEDRRVTAGLLLRSAEMFAVGHELSHVYLGHLESSAAKGQALWDQEYSADHLGLCLAIDALTQEGMPLDSSFWGAELYFGALEAIERAAHILKTGKYSATSTGGYPPPRSRIDALRLYFRTSLQNRLNNGQISPQDIDETFNKAELVRNALSSWAETSAGRWTELHQHSCRAASVWESLL
jgi:hypothetical protein